MKEIDQLTKLFERYARAQSFSSAFSDFLDWTLLPFKMHHDHEAQKDALERYQGHPKVDMLVPLITLIGDLSEGFSDPLGELYMRTMANGHMGQFFTPEPICQMMAEMQLAGEWPTNLRICEPTCGSGRMILAAARISRDFEFCGADLDLTCCKMTLANMLLNSLRGEVAHMNCLTNEFFGGYKVATALKNGFHCPYYVEFSDASSSFAWLGQTPEPKQGFTKPLGPIKSVPRQGVQGTLFEGF